jgi:HEPN domain-containing protein
MTFSKEIESFIENYVKDLNDDSASIFAGAGLSVSSGYVNWKELMSDLAKELGLNIDEENDLISIAQYHVNENGNNRYGITKKILEEFTEDVEESENHRIIARLPITSIWTTNYDQLIEKVIVNEKKNIDVKYKENQLLYTKPKREVVLYKMHGDVSEPDSTILTKQDYEQYFQTHETFVNALRGELITKTFLFIGFSFSDPNLDYILSRLHLRHGINKRKHYCFLKKNILGDKQNPNETIFTYNNIKQQLFINDLKRFGISSLLVEQYEEITDVLKEIEFRYNKQTVFISGSAEIYEPYSKEEALGYVNNISKILV